MTKRDTLKLSIGSLVYCTVTGTEGWRTVTAVRPRDGYIKIAGFGSWCPPHNFTLAPQEKTS